MRTFENALRIYVETYGQCDNGSLFGKWFDLTCYADLKEFLQEYFEFHRNEFNSDGYRPELTFQDKKNIPAL